MSQPQINALDELLAIMRSLRDPEMGCPWDRAQTPASIAPHSIEEAYEVADAIERNDSTALREELGDLLFQIVFQARLAEEAGQFDFAAVAATITAKLRRRHPHVFAGRDIGVTALNAEWERHKAEERAARGQVGALAGVAHALPALSRAYKLSQRAAATGFDWQQRTEVQQKVLEELAEVEHAVAHGSAAEREEEVGDLLFAVVNLARLSAVHPEQALHYANRKFERRFAAMEALAAARGQALAELSFAAWDELWNEAKRQLASRAAAGSAGQLSPG